MENPLPDWHRLSILYDGEEIMGCTLTAPKPNNSEELNNLIRDLIKFREATTVPDAGVFGKFSPID